MKFTCPNCHKECNFMDVQLDSNLRAIITMCDAFGRSRALVWAYAELFGITPFSAKAAKCRRVLEEMKMLFDFGEFAYQKRKYVISREGIVEALSMVVKKSFDGPLDSHNYLKRVMIGIADREAKGAGRVAEKDLRRREAGLMSGSREEETPPAAPRSAPYPIQEEQVEPPAMKTIPPAALTPEQREQNRRNVRALLDKIG